VTTLNRDEKAQVVAEVAGRLEATDTVVTADFRGLTVAELAQLREKLREADAEMTVVKNTLSRRAAEQTGRSALVQYLTGPTGLVWVNGDPARAAKALSDFEKAHQAVFTIRGGVLGAEDLPPESIVRLASLPSREQLLAQLAGGIAAPLTGLAGSLSSLIGTLARTLAAVQGSGALAPGEALAQEPAAESPAPEAAADAPAADTAAEAPVEEAPVEEAPGAEVPDEAPAVEAPTDTTVDEVPAAEAPTDEPAPGGESE
jgi:large subunit ribosomal protein L10